MALEKTLNLAQKNEIPQQFTSAEMTEIKNAVSQETTNVNITPYHIYSPNEHVVGEWQEMRDGVLKKKPVYEKKIAYTQNYETPLTWQIIADKSTEERLIKCYLETSIGCVYVYTALVEDKIKMNYAQAVYGNQFVVIQYTKTTDSWENV